jgi:hypothetical protein
MESTDKDVSALGAVMAFLYVTYIVLYAVLSTVLGNWVDKYLKQGHSARDALKYVGGVQFTVLCVIMLASTLVPRGAFAFNPKVIDANIAPSPDVEQATADNDSEIRKPGQRGPPSEDGSNEKALGNESFGQTPLHK